MYRIYSDKGTPGKLMDFSFPTKFLCRPGSIEKKKESFINNYSFPNERESVLEALLFIKSQVVSLSTKPKNGKNRFP